MARIYLDDCADDDLLAVFLQQAGHQVFTPRSDGTRGFDDDAHLSHATTRGYLLLTANPADFRRIHEAWALQGRSHPGILLVYQDNDVRKDLTREEIVRAVGRLLASGVPIAGDCHILNQWR